MLAKIAAVALMSAAVAACAGNPRTGTGPLENAGTLAGTPSGAVVGSEIEDGSEERVSATLETQIDSGSVERVAPAVAGAALVGLIGNRIGAAMDDEDKQRAYAAQIQALEAGPSGTPVAWRNPDSGHYGSIVPGPEYDQRGTKCRQYTHTVHIGGKPQSARGAACRNPNGGWTPII
jgi:surface antigen